MGEHRVSMLSASLRRYEDPARSSDPKIRAIVAQLRALEPAPPPRAHFRAELRSQLVAVAPRLVAEGVGAERPLTHAAKPASVHAEIEPRRAGRLGGAVALTRPLAITAAIVALFAMLLGGAVLLSRNALPGDTLYGLKRADESVQLALTSGDAARGNKYLQFASNRTHEVQQLLGRSSALAGGGATAGSGINSHTAKLVAQTLDSADSDVRNASRLLGEAAVDGKSTKPLAALAKWAPKQVQRLQAISARIPAGSSLATRTAQSTQLVTAALDRSQTLTTMLSCNCLDKAPTDSLGPVPCIVCGPTQTIPGVGSVPSGVLPLPSTTDGTTQSGGVSGSSTNSGDETPAGSTPSVTPPKLQLPSLGGTISIPPLPLPTPSSTRSPSCVVNLLGICVEI